MKRSGDVDRSGQSGVMMCKKTSRMKTIQYPQQHHPDGVCLSAKVVIVYHVEILLEFCVLLDTKWQSRLIEKQTWRKKVASLHHTCSVKVESISAEVELRGWEWEFNWKSIGCDTSSSFDSSFACLFQANFTHIHAQPRYIIPMSTYQEQLFIRSIE